jgi:GNAT superfamily N-acetyltransferase
MATQPKISSVREPVVRLLQETDLQAADRIFRLAFGTFLRLPDPMQFYTSADYVRTRWLADPAAAFAADLDGELVGSNFATNWGRIGFFGPVTVRPDLWDRGIAKRLLAPVMDTFENWGIRHAGLFTFPHSAKHVSLYQKFGFWPRFLTAIMSKAVSQKTQPLQGGKFSEIPNDGRMDGLKACRELTDAVYEGLDVNREILAVSTQGLGDTVLLSDESDLVGLAVCHCGPGTEAGHDACYIKFGAVRPGQRAGKHFERLLDLCEELARSRGLSRIIAGVNLARHRAYRKMLAKDFRTELQGVSMERPNEPGYNRSSVYLIDDWR